MKKIVCALLAAVMILTLVLSAVVTVSAADVPEIDFDDLLPGNVPGKPVVTVAEKTTVGTPVSITWEEATGAATYTVIIEQKDGEEWKEVEKFTEAASPLSVELAEGSYRACVLAVNAQGVYTASEDVEFAVTAAYIVGDMNDDGVVTDADAIYLLRHTLFGEAYPLSQPGDMNGDGQVTDADAIYLLRHTLFGEAYPLPQ